MGRRADGAKRAATYAFQVGRSGRSRPQGRRTSARQYRTDPPRTGWAFRRRAVIAASRANRGGGNAAMTSKMIALRILDGVFIGFTMLLMMGLAGLPMGWLLNLIEMSLREFQSFALFVVFAALLLIHAIVTSDSAP